MNISNLIPQDFFRLGQIIATPGAMQTVSTSEAVNLLRRHAAKDWGNLSGADRRENERSLKDGSRILSSYQRQDGKIWIITEADRSATTILLPEEY